MDNDDSVDNLPAVPEESNRDARGRFVKGAVANPLGRKKGTRNWIVEQKLAFEAALRDYVASPSNARQFLSAIDNLMRIAAGEGAEDKDSVAAMKILTDKFMASGPTEDDGPKAMPAIQIVIENHTKDAIPSRPTVVIDTEYHDAKSEPEATQRDGSGESREIDAGDSG